ncbi:hypothetical protein [Roseomonas xinghualingensis]|uniref:hypothetical protein n=1 Tax=Roseomonas xinghualingensis TaxID=2986475 RepID=UPI0021F10DC3|nr:hypothetical protein [Roseomonas sp. SXEYE001]MCV4209349.1 hypothetical protein [Roseomonas sp. SXEYE001]
MTFHGTPPTPAAGSISHRTKALRPDIGLSEELVDAIRRERKKGQEPTQIAETLTLPLEVVEKALLAMRMPQPGRTRATLNVTREAGAFVHRECAPGEPVWKAMDRLIGELIELRGRA